MSDLLDAARLGRRSGAALKVRLAELRSRFPGTPIFVFEGRDDIGPYECWINRVRSDIAPRPLAGNGKGQLLDLRLRLARDRTGMKDGTYLFVDRDFDELRDQNPGADIYCTAKYSVENYFVSGGVLTSILLDDFRLDQYPDAVEEIERHYVSLLEQFLGIMREPNWRMFYGAKTSTWTGNIKDSITQFVDIQWDQVARAYDSTRLLSLIPLSTSPVEAPVLVDEFRELDPIAHYRGKHILAFFLTWLERLSAALVDGVTSFLPEPHQTGFDRSRLNLRNLASRSELPSGLSDFLESV